MILLNKLQQIENFILRTGHAGENLVFEARVLTDEELARDVALQTEAYAIIKQYGRRKLKAEIASVHLQLFTEDKHFTFRQMILALFKE